MSPFEELEEDVTDADSLESPSEGRRTEIEEELVAVPGVDVDRAQAAKRVGMAVDHAHRIPREPARPDIVAQQSALGFERQVDRAVLVRRVARGHRPRFEEVRVVALRERGPRVEVLPEAVERALVLVPKRAHGVAE